MAVRGGDLWQHRNCERHGDHFKEKAGALKNISDFFLTGWGFIRGISLLGAELIIQLI